MPKEKRKIDLGMKDVLDEMFMDDTGRAENHLPKIYDIPLGEIDDFPNHPFQIRDDEDMDNLVASIKERGIITPATVRKKEDGRYELISGHRRKHACELAGLETLRCDVVELDKDAATILMVDSNCQRSTILPSEKAFSYKMKMEALSHQGTSCQVGTKLRSDEEMAKTADDSARQIQRYIRLTNLIPELLELVDSGKIALSPAVELSYLSEDMHRALLDAMNMNDCTPSHAQAIRMKQAFQNGLLNKDMLDDILSEEKPNQVEKLKIPMDRIRKYFPSDYTVKQIEDNIVKYCEAQYQKRVKDKGAR